jgi:hypothetical protein
MRRSLIGALALLALIGATLLAAVPAGGKKDDDDNGNGNRRASKSIFFAHTNGRNEISPTGQRGAGDPDGRGSFTGLIAGDKFCFGITVAGLSTPTAAHIHQGKKRVNGPIVIPLTAPSSGDPGASSGCVAADPALLAAIAKHPRRYYVNVHTGDFPAGAVRGQLHGKHGKGNRGNGFRGNGDRDRD